MHKSYFPIRIYNRDTKKKYIIKRQEDFPKGTPFVVLATKVNIHRKEHRNVKSK